MPEGNVGDVVRSSELARNGGRNTSSELARNGGRNSSSELARNGGRNSSSELARNGGRNDPITYRGSDLDELLPKIRAELGADAIVIRQREGLDGGFGGFFQKRCVEVVARRATPGLDAYDAAAGSAPLTRDSGPEPPAPAIAEIMRVASPFIEQLRAAEVAVAEPEAVEPVAVEPVAVEPLAVEEQRVTGAFGTSAYAMTAGGAMALAPAVDEPPVAPAPPLQLVPRAVVAPEPEPEPELVVRAAAAAAQERALVAAGIAPQLAAELVEATISHVLPFHPRRTLKRALREALARRIALFEPPPLAAGGRAIAFVGAGGSGKSLCAARLAAAYAEHSDMAVSIVSLDAPAPEPAAGGDRTMTVIDTAAVSPACSADVKRLATALRRAGRPEVHVTVPATLSGNAVRALLDGFAVLKPAAIVLTHLDEVGHAGPVIDEAIARGIAISYTSDGSALDGFAPADPAVLAGRILA